MILFNVLIYFLKGMIIINILPKHTKSGKSLITAVNRSTTAKDLASYAKSQLGVKGNLRFYKSTKTSETLSPNSILHTLPVSTTIIFKKKIIYNNFFRKIEFIIQQNK